MSVTNKRAVITGGANGIGLCAKKYDTVVIGGGFSGVAAALAAARGGLSVLLIEKGNCMGGSAVSSLVNPFMPFWTSMKDGAAGEQKRKYLSAGIFREILNNLSESGALGKNETTFDEEVLKLILNRMTIQAGIDLLFHSYLIGAGVNNESIQTVTAANKSGCMELSADYFIDATGDADLAALCGVPFRVGRESDGLCQPMTLCFRLANVDMDAYRQSRHTITPLYKEMQKQGRIKNIREDVLIFDTLTE